MCDSYPPAPGGALADAPEAPAPFEELQALAERTLDELVREFPLGYVPGLVWKNLRVTAGLAHYRERRITLSRTLLTTPDRLLITLKHEYAHLLAVVRFGKRGAGHSPAWRQAMVELGEEPRVYHRYPAQRNQARQEVAYQCVRCGTVLFRQRRLPHGRTYVHARCGGRLTFLYARLKTDSPGLT